MRKLLTIGMRDVLIEHIDNPVPIIRACNIKGPEAKILSTKYKSIWACMDRGFLTKDRDYSPRFTLITELGRAELAHASVIGRMRWCELGTGAGFCWEP